MGQASSPPASNVAGIVGVKSLAFGLHSRPGDAVSAVMPAASRGVKTEIFEERHEKVAWVLCVPKGRSVE